MGNALIKMSRVWSMPSRWTFTIKPIADLLARYVGDGKGWIDPFAGENSPAEITNDDKYQGCTFNLDALEFLNRMGFDHAGVLFDPPYSTEQCLRSYKSKAPQQGTAGRAEYWGKCRDQIGRIIKQNGVAISFCWDSTGMGKKRGFEIVEILLVCHGACHNDTIVTVERKIQSTLRIPPVGVEK